MTAYANNRHIYGKIRRLRTACLYPASRQRRPRTGAKSQYSENLNLPKAIYKMYGVLLLVGSDPGFPIRVSNPTPEIYDESSFAEIIGQGWRAEASDYIPRSQTEGDLHNSAASSRTAQGDCPPMTRHHSSRELERVQPGSFVKKKIVSNTSVMDILALHLDRSVHPGKRGGVHLIQRWEHLADEFNVPDEIKRQCETHTGDMTPSEALFNYLYVMKASLAIGTLKGYLRKLGREDVVTALEERSLAANATVTDLCDKFPETLCNVCLKLDDKRFVKNWKHLGMSIGLDGATLRRFKDPFGDSPTEVILKKIETLKPSLPLVDMKNDLRNLELSAVAEVLDELPVEGTIKTLLDDRYVLEKVSSLLDLHESSWWKFGLNYGIQRKELEILKPECPQSPTKLLIEYVVGQEPNLNMRSFLKALANIKRNDAIEELIQFFYAEDINNILRQASVGGPPQ